MTQTASNANELLCDNNTVKTHHDNRSDFKSDRLSDTNHFLQLLQLSMTLHMFMEMFCSFIARYFYGFYKKSLFISKAVVKENMPDDPSYKTKFSNLCWLLRKCSKFQFQVTQQINCFVNNIINSTLTKRAHKSSLTRV